MELKSAASVCLISLFSATLVVLIARAMDTQAAGQLEPHLIRIADELSAIRRGGGSISPGGFSASEVDGEMDSTGGEISDGLVVYYFHGNVRCVTCRSIESQAKQAVESHFGEKLKGGEIVWKILNYERPAGAEFQKKFEIQVPVIVLALMKNGKVEKWERLDRVWALVGDPGAFDVYVKGEVGRILGTAGGSTGGTAKAASNIPIP